MMAKKSILIILVLIVLTACEDIFEVTDISEQQVALLAPSDQAMVNDSSVTFNWTEVFDAESYLVQIASPNFQNASQLLLDSLLVVDSTFSRTRITQNLASNQYEWRVKAFNSAYETPFSTNAFEVLVQGTAPTPNTPQLLTPENNASSTETTVAFTWSRDDLANTQELDSIFIFQDEALSTLQTKGLGTDKSFSLELTAGTYYWFVQAFTDAGVAGQQSETFQFSVTQ